MMQMVRAQRGFWQSGARIYAWACLSLHRYDYSIARGKKQRFRSFLEKEKILKSFDFRIFMVETTELESVTFRV